MSAENSPDEHIPVGALPPQVRQKTGYVERLKIQKNRLKGIHINEDSSSTVQKLLPKIKKTELHRVNTSALSRSGTLESIKLPSVISERCKHLGRLKKRDEVFVKSLSVSRMFPEYTSLLSKSLPSLPSIPGSPGLDEIQSILDEDTDRQPTPVYHSKNRYQTIAVRKNLEKRNTLEADTEDLNSHRSERSDHHYIKHKSRIPQPVPVLQLDRDHTFMSTQCGAVKNEYDIVDRLNLPRRYRKKDRTVDKQRRFRSLDARSDAMSVKSDSILNSIKPKWNENCDCLRCKMLKRKFKDGDDSYKVWGQYPCNREKHSEEI